LNVEQYDVGTPGSLANDLLDAIGGISGLNVIHATAGDVQPIMDLAYPADPTAQRSTKALVAYTDDTYGRVHTAEVPGYNDVGLLPNSDDIDLANAAIAAFVTAFEAFDGPDGGVRNVVYMRKVSRNS
jgi:hypothetical protein